MTDTPTPPMTPEQRAEFVAWLRRVRMRPTVADQLEADGVTIATLTAERDAAKDGEKTARNLMQKAFGVNRKVIAERDAAQAEIEALQRELRATVAERNRAQKDCELIVKRFTAREDDGNPRPIETAPKDGTMLRLLVDYEGVENWMPLTDDNQSWTIGFNTLEDTGDDEWIIAGWNWSQDCFGTGEGKVIGWLPFAAITKGAAT